MKELTEEERKALRGSKFAPLPPRAPQHPPSSSSSRPPQPSRQAHPGGPLKTNKAAALAKFLERKLQDPNSLASLDPRLVELAVKNAKQTVQSGGASSSGRRIQHVESFSDSEETAVEEEVKISVPKKKKKKKKKNKLKEKQHKKLEESLSVTVKRPKRS